MTYPCLNCRQPLLPEPSEDAWIACGQCGMTYSADLMRATDLTRWLSILNQEDGYSLKIHDTEPPTATVYTAQTWSTFT